MTLLIASLALLGALVANQTPQAVAQMGRVSGQVIEDGTNTAVSGARVFVVVDSDLAAPAGPPPTTVTDRDGRYHFDTLPAGRYRIAAQKAGFAPPMEPGTMQMFEVFGGQALDGLTVSLRRGAVITGRVLDSDGRPIAEVGVTALLKRLGSIDRREGPIASGSPLLMPAGQNQTNDLGEFRIFGLSPGEYVISANPRSDFSGVPASSPGATMMASTFFPGTTDVSDAQPVTVQTGETASDLTIRLVTVAAYQVSGAVVDEAGAPVPGVMVMLMRGRRGADSLLSLSMGPPGMSQSDASGRFTFGDVSAGSYTLRADRNSGFFASSDDFIIDGAGTPRAGPNRPNRAPAPGVLEITIKDANIGDLKLVVPGSP